MQPLHDPGLHQFASDNYSGVHPEVLAAIAAANGGHLVSYGEDPYTARLSDVMRGHFGETAETFVVVNGTGANVVSLQSILPRWGAIVCAYTAHINADENGAVERVGGLKLLPVVTPNGKLTTELIDVEAWGWENEHRAQPLAVSISNTTELGTLYTPDEIRAIADHAHERGMLLHLDGSRLANAAASLGLPLAAFTTDAGVDVLSLGGTKLGALGAEAVVVLNPAAVSGIKFLRKIDLQLPSKMRFFSAQMLALYEGDLYLRNAGRANDMALRLRNALEGVPGLEFTQRTQANAVFAVLPRTAAERVRAQVAFYDWNEAAGEVRWMCSFDTTDDAVDRFASIIRAEVESERG